VVKQMDAQNKWNAARKVMKEIESRRIVESTCECLRDAGVTLWKQFCALV
jgi:hypothetical protein